MVIPMTASIYRAVFLIAFATLLFEVTLTRILSFTIWYHFAYVIISTALLGYGAAGALLAVRSEIGRRDPMATIGLLAVCAGLSSGAAVGVISAFPFDPMQIFSSPRHASILLVYQLAVAVPFFFSGLAISLALRDAAEQVDRLYFWDLVGAGAAACIAVPLMNSLTPPGAALASTALFSAVGAACWRHSARRVAAIAAAGLLSFAALFASHIHFEPAASKHLALHIYMQKMKPVFSKWTALFRTDVVASDPTAFDFTNQDEWGISLASPEPIQPFWGFITHDASAGTSIYDLKQGRLDFLDDHTQRMPYLVVPEAPNVLVIGVGGGRDVIAADRFGASQITGVELDPVTIDLLREDHFGISDDFFRQEHIRLVPGEGRHFVAANDDRFDLIQITAVDTLAAQSSGAYVLAENYLYTVEAFSEYLDHLTPGGLLCVTTGHLDDVNPKSSGRMVSVAREVLRRRGVTNPGDHIAVITSRTMFANVMVKPVAFSADELQRLAAEADRLEFVPLWLRGAEGKPIFRALADAKGPAHERALREARYVLTPTTDDSPFFFRFYRWKDLLDLRDPLGAEHTTALGQIVLVVLLLLLTLLAAFFILGPLVVFGRRGTGGPIGQRLGVLFYFGAVGIGFMLFEISLMQRFVLFLGYPTYSLTVTLAALLIFLGCGSFLSRRFVGREQRVLPLAVVGIAVLALGYGTLMPAAQALMLPMSLPIRVTFTVAVLAPLGLLLGMFFPLGIRQVLRLHEDLVPWAWAINGCASVTGTVLAVVLAMGIGFTGVWTISVVLYACGVAALLLATGRRPSEA